MVYWGYRNCEHKISTWMLLAQLVSARLSEQEVPGSILGDFNVCFDFPLIRVAIALNTRKTEHWAHRRLPLIPAS